MVIFRGSVLYILLLLLTSSLLVSVNCNVDEDTSKYGNLHLMKVLKARGHIVSNIVFETLLRVDRGTYLRPFTDSDPYVDSAVSIGDGATASAPHMWAICLELLKDNLVGAKRVLDVGSGTGYLTIAFGEIMSLDYATDDDDMVVVGIDSNEAVLRGAKEAVMSDRYHHKKWVDSGRVKFVLGNGIHGYLPNAPFDVIHVGAAAEKIPEDLISQLAPGGRMVIPIGAPNQEQVLVVVDKDKDGSISKREIMHVLFVPLKDKPSLNGHAQTDSATAGTEIKTFETANTADGVTIDHSKTKNGEDVDVESSSSEQESDEKTEL